MKNIKLLLILSALVLLSCSKAEPINKTKYEMVLDTRTISLPFEKSEKIIQVSSEVAWTVQKAEPCAWLTVTRASGKASEVVNVILSAAANNASLESRSVTLLFVPSDGYSDVVKLKVSQAAPSVLESFSFNIPEDGPYLKQTVFSSLGGCRSFGIRSNVKWTASVDASSSASGIILSESQGDGDMAKFEVKLSSVNKDMDSRKSVVIAFTTEMGNVHKLALEQEKGSVITLELRVPDNSTSFWPFDQEAPTTAGNCSETTSFYTVGGTDGYRFGWHATSDCMFEPNFGWRIGKGVGNYVEFPAIAGRKLTKVSVVDANGWAQPHIKDVNGQTVAGGSVSECSASKAGSSYQAYCEQQKMVSWDLTGTESGAPYRFQATNASTMRLRHLELVYE